MLLRSYRPGDLVAVHAINQAEVPAVGDETLDALGHIAEQSAIAIVAEDDEDREAGADERATGTSVGVIGGFCMVLAPGADYHSGNYRWFSERSDHFVYLDRVAIAPAYQRRGLGRALYAEVERLAVERCPGAKQFALEVNLRPRNDTSLAFHAALGFVEVGQRETSYGALVSLMSKPL